jgi:hypothetical protein
MRRIVLTALSLALWAFAAGGALACTSAQVAAPGEAVRTARAALMRIPLGEMDTLVRPDAQRAIEATKDRIVAFVTVVMACTESGTAPATIQRLLAARGDAFEDRTVYTENNLPPDRHGSGLSYEVARVPGHPRMLAVVARLAIECGDDAVLLLFQRRARAWAPVLIRRSPPYREVSGAFGTYRYAVSPPDSRGRWYLATVRRPPWCTSAWSSLYYEFSRPGRTPARPNIFFRASAGDYAGYDDRVTLRAEPARFRLAHDGGFFDPGILIRRHVETYAVAGNRVSRIQPVALNVRDFVDEWLSRDWVEASGWSGPGLAAVHRRLGAGRDGSLYLEQGPIRRCGSGLHQVEIDPRQADPNGRDPPPWYFLVRGNGPYRLEGATRSQWTRCRGPDLAPTIERASASDWWHRI